GVANDRSIAWGVARQAAAQGADLAFTYLNHALARRVRPLADSIGSDFLISCDVSDPASVDATFAEIEKRWGKLDYDLHAIAYSYARPIVRRYVDTTLDNSLMTMNISCYSSTAVAQRSEKLMTAGGSLVTLSYAGAEPVMPHY